MYTVPLNDTERVAALRNLQLLDSVGSSSFDAIVQFVQTALDASMSMISLVDEHRQWFLASRGLELKQTPRDAGFCNYAVACDEPLLVTDARCDPRFADSPLVQGHPEIRSYLGYPLHAGKGQVVGTLCAADTAPEKFTPSQIPMLQSLAKVVEDLFAGQADHLALQRAAEIDGLTGLLNRGAFGSRLASEIRLAVDSMPGPVVMMFDLHGFRYVNDTYGQLYGDLVLEELGERLRAVLPPDHAARWGGHAFTVLLPQGVSDFDVTANAAAIMGLLAQPVRISSAVLNFRVSCGVVRYGDGDKAGEMLHRAELALHQGKQRSRDIHVYDPLCEDRERIRILAEAEVHAALESDRIFIGYQPIVALHDRAIQGYEALMRVTQPDGKVLTAGQLLPALSNPGLSRRIATRMTALVAAEFANVARITPGSCYVSLNATESDLLSDAFAPMLLETLAGCDIAPERVMLEITETMLVSDLDKVKTVLDALKTRGMQVALDDFGTGYSSLTRLKMFPIDKVKIDRSFVKDIMHDQNARSIVAAVVTMAKNLSIDVIAEGVEEEVQAALLLKMGCTCAQGYLFSPAHNIAYHELNWRNTMAQLQRGAAQALDAPAARRGAGQFA